jgi:hypothetical protein
MHGNYHSTIMLKSKSPKPSNTAKPSLIFNTDSLISPKAIYDAKKHKATLRKPQPSGEPSKQLKCPLPTNSNISPTPSVSGVNILKPPLRKPRKLEFKSQKNLHARISPKLSSLKPSHLSSTNLKHSESPIYSRYQLIKTPDAYSGEFSSKALSPKMRNQGKEFNLSEVLNLHFQNFGTNGKKNEGNCGEDIRKVKQLKKKLRTDFGTAIKQCEEVANGLKKRLENNGKSQEGELVGEMWNFFMKTVNVLIDEGQEKQSNSLLVNYENAESNQIEDEFQLREKHKYNKIISDESLEVDEDEKKEILQEKIKNIGQAIEELQQQFSLPNPLFQARNSEIEWDKRLSQLQNNKFKERYLDKQSMRLNPI